MTYRRGAVTGARFTSDGQSVVYSARFGEEAERLFLARIGSPESLPIPLPDATRLGVTPDVGVPHDEHTLAPAAEHMLRRLVYFGGVE